LDISINKLSKAINVDSSLVNRWIHGKRIPSYTTPYVESISDYLSKNIHNTFQEKRINEFFQNTYENNKSIVNDIEIESTKEKIRKLLLEAQGYSIECNKKEQKEQKELREQKEQKEQDEMNQQNEMKDLSISKAMYAEIIKSNQLCFTKQKYSNAKGQIANQSDTENHICNQKGIMQLDEFSSEDKIIVGIENIVAASNFLLDTAASQPCRNNNTIYITYNQEMDIEKSPYNGLFCWGNILLKAIHNGWNVLFLVRLDRNVERIIKFINFAKPLIKTGKFIPYYLKKYSSVAFGKELIVVPEVGALSGFSTNSDSEIDSAFYIKSKTAVDIYKNHFHVLLETYAHPLVKYYSDENKLDYADYLAECEDEIGNRYLYKYSFSLLTMSENLFQRLLKRKKCSQDEMQIALEFYRKRLKAFLSNLQKYEFKDIYMTDSIKDLIIQRQFYFYSFKGVEQMELEVQDVIEYIQNIIRLLETYENYSIAFIPKNMNSTLKNCNFYCLVKERQAVLFEIFESSPNVRKMQLSIEEPMLVNGFYEYYKEIWENIAPVNNDKDKVIAWLQDQINLLQRTAAKG
jgi:hypothetical protein